MSHFQNILRRRQKQSSLDRFLVKVKPGEPQPGPTSEKRQRREREKIPECQIPEVSLEADSPSKQEHLLSTTLVSTRLFSAR
jgi:hypothetical protein